MNNQDILGMNSAYEHAKQCAYGANMSISAALVVDMAKLIAELEKELGKAKGLLFSAVLQSKLVRATARNTKSVRTQHEMSGYVKHYILSRSEFNSVEMYLKEQSNG